jgi:RHS repeat-associated protein
MNNHGDVMALFDASGTQIVAKYERDPWGVLLSATGPAANVCPFGFQTKYYDAETGLYYINHRYYSPTLGRWMSRDPIAERGGYNFYSFCNGNPFEIDQLGMATWNERENTVDQMYREGRPIAAFLYDSGVRAWNGFSFGMLNRQANQEDALANGDISLGRYAAGATVNAGISGVQLALTVGGVGQVATTAKGATTLLGVVGQGAVIGGKIGFIGSAVDVLGTRISDAAAGIDNQQTVQQDAKTVLIRTGEGSVVGAGLSGLSYTGLKLFSAIREWRESIALSENSEGLQNIAYKRSLKYGGEYGELSGEFAFLARKNGTVDVIGHRDMLDVVDINKLANELKLLTPKRVNLIVCEGANGNQAALLAEQLKVPVLANREILRFYPSVNAVFADNPGGWSLIKPTGGQ